MARSSQECFYTRHGKRYVDIVASLIALACLFVPLLFTYLILRVTLGPSPFFFQKRPGKHGQLFAIYKFKTMTDARDVAGNLLPDAQRLTKVGKVVRALSLDEALQLLNVLRGEMSLVGPRPLLPEYLPLYNAHQSRRHEVLPGITGLAQISGRNTLTWEEKFEQDVRYVDSLSFILDLKIVALTVVRMFDFRKINNSEGIPMPRFLGTPGGTQVSNSLRNPGVKA